MNIFMSDADDFFDSISGWCEVCGCKSNLQPSKLGMICKDCADKTEVKDE